MIKVKSYAVKTDQGPYLNLNEDGYEVDHKNGLFSILDCFGGSGYGDKALQITKEILSVYYQKITQDPNATLPFYFDAQYLIETNAIINAYKQANKKIAESFGGEASAGGSVCSLAICGPIVSLVSIGNCAAYLLRGGKLRQILLPDSYANLSSDFLDEHLLTAPRSALGLPFEPQIVIRECRPRSGDLFVMLTDGIYSRIKNSEMEYFFNTNPIDLHEKIDMLFSLANERGNLDNQTALCVKF